MHTIERIRIALKIKFLLLLFAASVLIVQLVKNLFRRKRFFFSLFILLMIVFCLTLSYVMCEKHKIFNQEKYEKIQKVRFEYYYDREKWVSECAANPDTPFSLVRPTTDLPFLDGKQIISTSLYGFADKYFIGACEFSKKVKIHLPDWHYVVFMHDKVDPKWDTLLSQSGAYIIKVSDAHVKPGNSAGAFWRFVPFTRRCKVISVDADDGKDAIIELINFIETWGREPGRPVAYIRKFFSFNTWPYPNRHLTAKMFGFDGLNFAPEVTLQQISHFPKRGPYGCDEIFTSEVIYPIMVKRGQITYFDNILSIIIYLLNLPSFTFGEFSNARHRIKICKWYS
jgi:hypothetical protein